MMNERRSHVSSTICLVHLAARIPLFSILAFGRWLLLFRGSNTSAAMRAFPVALLKVGARIGDLFAAILAGYGDVIVFGHISALALDFPIVTAIRAALMRRGKCGRSTLAECIATA